MVRGVDGRGFAFVPRTVVAQPKAFGMAPGLLEPAHDVDATSERYRAAMLQHVMAVAVRAELLKSEGISPAVFVSRFEDRGLGADRVRRIFRGETMAQLTDLMFWTTHLSVVADAISECIAGFPAVERRLDVGDETVPDVAGDLTVGAETAAEVADGSPVPDPESLERARRDELLRMEQAAAGVGPEAMRIRREQAARKRGVGVPRAGRSPQNPYEPSPRRMR